MSSSKLPRGWSEWNVEDRLGTPEERRLFLEAALEEGDAEFFQSALGAVARAEGMTRLAERTGLNRENLYRALSPEGNPTLSTVLKVVGALGLRMCLVPSGAAGQGA